MTGVYRGPVLSTIVSRIKAAGKTQSKPKVALPEFFKDDRIRAAAAELQAHGNIEVVTSFDCLDRANRELAAGGIDGVVSVAFYSSREVILSGLKHVGLCDGVKRLSSCFIMELPDNQSFIFSDCAVQIDPSAKQLAEIAKLSAQSCRMLLEEEPVVAMLSFSTLGSVASGGKTEIVRDAIKIIRQSEEKVHLKAFGELQVDSALVPLVFKVLLVHLVSAFSFM